MIINGEAWVPYYNWVYNGPYSVGYYVLAGWRKVERNETNNSI